MSTLLKDEIQQSLLDVESSETGKEIDPLSLIMNVEIDNKKKLSPTDEIFVNDLNDRYLNTHSFLVKSHSSFEASIPEEIYIDMEDITDEFKKTIKALNKEFISDIKNRFTSDYQISLDFSCFTEKITIKAVKLSDLIDEIFNQLDGFSFEDKASEEIKEASRKFVYRKENIKVKKNKLTISDRIYWDTHFMDGSISHFSYNSTTEILKFFTALCHYDSNKTDAFNFFKDLCSYNTRPEEFWTEKKDLSWMNKIKSMRMFKNGRIDIEFKEYAQANEFASEYLGYNL